MRALSVVIGLAIFGAPCAWAQAGSSAAACAQITGAKVISDDGTFLGTVSSHYDGDSIFNKYGKGSKYATESVWNKYGTYGSEYSMQSTMSKFTSTPPMLIKDGHVIGYLTRNKMIEGAVDPVILGAVCFDFVAD